MADPCAHVTVGSKKRDIWNEADILALIDVWSENLDDLRKAKRNSHVYEAMRKQLVKEHAVERSTTEVKNKVTNLARDYRRERAKLTSNCSPSTWKYYNRVNALLGCLPTNDNSLIQENSSQVENEPQVHQYAVVSTAHSVELVPVPVYDEVLSETWEQLSDAPSLAQTMPDFDTPLATPGTSKEQDGTTNPKKRKKPAERMADAMEELCAKQVKYQDDCTQIDSKMLSILEQQLEIQKQSHDAQLQMIYMFANFFKK